MSVPYNVKIKVLGRITPPLKDPGPSSPAVQVRGGIVAVEGENGMAVLKLTSWLKEFLAKDKEYSPRIAEPPRSPSADVKDVSFEEYLDLIKEWHGKSKDMVKYITTPVSSSPPSSPSDKDSSTDAAGKDKDGTSTPPKSPVDTPSPKPVIILPTYQLSASDAYASKIPIQDVYSPMDHWQWMATLWRGTVGPDLTIYVRNYPDLKDGSNGTGAIKKVDINEEGRCLTVFRDADGEFAEGSLRRVGFEVGEWIRGLGRGAKAGA